MNWHKFNIDVNKIRGAQGKTLCPQCSEDRKHKNDPCLSVNMETGLFNCKHCGWSGCVKEYERQPMEKKEYKKPEPRPAAVGEKMITWFKSRGISNETLLRAKVTEAVEFIPQVNKERNCTCFNYYRDGELVNIKFRDGEKNFKLVSGAELIFYNLDAIKGRVEAIITEGEIDALSLMEMGISNVVSVPNGASKGNQKLVYLDNCIDNFTDKEKIILLTDNDEAGISLQKELIRRLGAERCYTVRYPDGCKDANEVLLKHGAETLQACILMARQCPLEGIVTVDSLRDRIHDIAKNGWPEVLSLSYKGLNELIRWRGGELTVVTGTPSHGKSEMLDQIIIELSLIHDWRFGVFSPENQPQEAHVIKLMEKCAGTSLRYLSSAEIDRWMDFLNDHFYFLSIDENDLTIDGILAKAKELVARYGIKGFVIDPFNYVEHSLKGQSKTDYISEFLTKVCLFCGRYDVHTFLVAHPTKLYKDKQTGKYPVPTLYDISDSAHFYNKTFNGICVYRNFDTGVVEVHVQKVKFKWVGKTGIQMFNYDIPSGRYSEVGPEIAQVDSFDVSTQRISQSKSKFSREDKENDDGLEYRDGKLLDDEQQTIPF